MNCAACSNVNPDNARFCLHCGATLDGRTALAADPQRAMLERSLGVQYARATRHGDRDTRARLQS